MYKMFFGEPMTVETSTRYPKPLSEVPEDMTVVTASEIEAMHAHNLADVLQYVTGIMVFQAGGVGSISQAYINGSDPRYVAVYLDGVLLNNLTENVADVAQVPAQIIDRIEIIKGPGSSVWGSSLGGVINVITKSGRRFGNFNGTLLGSFGERATDDTRGEVFGYTGSFDYYVNAGYFNTNGFNTPHNMLHSDNEYLKAGYDLGTGARLTVTMVHLNGSGGMVEVPSYGLTVNRDYSTFLTTAALEGAFSESFGYSLSLRYSELLSDVIDAGTISSDTNENDRGYGATLKFTYKGDAHSVVLGGDADWRTLTSQLVLNNKQHEDKKAVFVNDTVVLGNFSITLGIRYDVTGISSDFFSPSLGATYKLSDSFLLRAYSSRGFNAPPISYRYAVSDFFIPDLSLKVEKVWSNQIGVETAALPYVWLKGTVFQNDVTDAITYEQINSSTFTYVNSQSQRTRGFGMEAKTSPVFNLSVVSGFEYTAVSTKNDDTQPNQTVYSYNFGLRYDDKRSFTALLQGRYDWWNAVELNGGRYNSMVFDVSAEKSILKSGSKQVSIFAKTNNIFNSDSFLVNIYPTARRWIEGGIRCVF